jgi:hypothetical protein
VEAKLASRLPTWLRRLEQSTGDPEKVKLAVTLAHYQRLEREAVEQADSRSCSG